MCSYIVLLPCAIDNMFARVPTPDVMDNDDPAKEKDSELENIDKFNQLLQEQKFEEAAIHAANSPKGMLRTIETMNRFKGLFSKDFNSKFTIISLMYATSSLT